MDVREKKSEHLTTENAGNGEAAGEKTTVTEVQGIHLDLDPFEAHCDTYRIDDKQDGTSSFLLISDLHYTVLHQTGATLCLYYIKSPNALEHLPLHSPHFLAHDFASFFFSLKR